jgi:calcyclin binding protein
MEVEQSQATATAHPIQEYIDDLDRLLKAAAHPRSVALLQKALEEAEREAVANGAAKDSKSGAKPRTAGAPVTRSTHKISQYGWDQTSKVIKIYITSISDLSQASNDDVRAKFKDKSFEVEVKAPKGKVYSLVITDLFEPIVPDGSFVKLKSGTVIVTLKKSSTKEWSCLTAIERKLKDAREPKTPKMDKSEDPGASLMGLMKQMYQDGDDDTKRTIAKAWHESQGKRMKDPSLPEI